MPSRIVKALNVVKKEDTKIVSIPNDEQLPAEVSEPLHHSEQQMDQASLELEFVQRERVQAELAEWKKKEQELFLLELEEEKRRGYNEGYQVGIQEGKQHGQEQYTELIENGNRIVEQAFQEKKAIIHEADPFVIELSVEIAKKVIQQELTINQEALTHMIKRCLSTVYESSSLSIGVAPADFAFVQKQREQLLAVVNGQVEVKVLPDYTIQQGGCIIRTSSGSVDARIDVQLSEIKKALLSYQQELDTRE